MIFGSVCSGIEAASVAWGPLGWKPAFFSEIEKFPSQVLNHHYPDVPNHGDMTKFKEWPDHAIRLLCGGTPCQSFSIAGLRKGLDDARGNLMLTFGEIAARYRPQWVVWENVPGVLSSNAGQDFAAFLGLLSGGGIHVPVGGWQSAGIIHGYKNAYGLAYRVFDAVGFGCAASRKRVFVVGYLGDWRAPTAVLFERESFEFFERQGAKTAAPTLTAKSGRRYNDSEIIVVEKDGPRWASVTEAERMMGFPDGYTDLSQPPIYGRPAEEMEPENSVQSDRRSVSRDAATTAQSLRSVRMLDGEASSRPRSHNREGARDIVSSMQYQTPSDRGYGMGNASVGISGDGARITPADGPRYKSLGNSWAVPNVRWIGERIQMVDDLIAGLSRV